MYYGKIYEVDTANGPGMRTSLFVSGCTHHCKGCFNEETWDFNFGKPYTPEVEDYIINTLYRGYVSGLTVLGGEPMELVNQKALVSLFRRVNPIPDKDIWVYTGYTFETIPQGPFTREILSLIDVLVDGPFVVEEKNLRLKFRGSNNQRVIDVPKSLECNEILWKSGFR